MERAALALLLLGCGGTARPAADACAGCVFHDGAGFGFATPDDAPRVDARYALVVSQEGHACSADPADTPQYVCGRGQGLGCIATHSVRDSDGGIRKVFVCRRGCPLEPSCSNGDVCCPGEQVGTYDHPTPGMACVPPAFCAILQDGGP